MRTEVITCDICERLIGTNKSDSSVCLRVGNRDMARYYFEDVCSPCTETLKTSLDELVNSLASIKIIKPNETK